MLGFTRNIITVTFVDDVTGRVVSTSRMPLERLPETFAVDTELDMAGARYTVVRAEPSVKAEFKRTRQLKVVLRKQALSQT
jgi:hypothetical protein